MFLYITRHGKTEWNTEGRFQGAKDSPLIDSGIQDASLLGNYLKNQHFQDIYTSPLGRAIQTTKLIFPSQSFIQDVRIMEMNFGIFEGMKTEEILEQYFELYNNLWNHPENFTRCPGGGESFNEVKLRAIYFVSMLKRTYGPNDKVFITTHGMFYIVLMAYFKKLHIYQYPLINQYIVRGCSLTIVEITDSSFNIICEGDDHFLPVAKKDSYIIKK